MYGPNHFYITFNPHLNDYLEADYTQAHEFFDYLKEEITSNKNGYAYWGKIIARDRESSINIDRYRDLIKNNQDNNCSTHLYITDFKNIWVGKVESIHRNIGNDFKTLQFYKEKNVEVWFKLSDFTLLEYCYESTANKLSELYIDNDYMKLKIDELSPFTTGIKYPAIVQDLSEEQFFDQLEENETHLILNDNAAINTTGLLQVSRTLQTFALPEPLYSMLPHSARFEIQSAELDMLERRHHNIKKIAFSYIKALEMIVNDLTIGHLKRAGLGDQFFVKPAMMPPKLYLDDREDDLLPIGLFQKNYSMNQLVYFFQRCVKSGRIDFARAYKGQKLFLKYFTQDFPKRMEHNHIYEMRGVLAHSDSCAVSIKDAMAVRNLILGVGHMGVIHELYHHFSPELLRPMAQVQSIPDDGKKITSKDVQKILKKAS